jgi:L-asparaginase II
VEPLVVEVLRGETVESRHRVHAVAVRAGEVVELAGDPTLVTFMRSSAKPLQALPLARAYPDLSAEELAIASASHLAQPEQLAAVERLLERSGSTEDDLECGAEGTPPSKLRHNCSGKHAGMLAVCRAHGWPTTDYRLPDHPLQELLLAEIAGAAEVSGVDIPTATDGCGVVTYALPLVRMAAAFARLHELGGGDTVAAAMRAHPRLVRGPGGADTVLMEQVNGWVAKRGAEGLMCAAGPEGLGLAFKVEDGASRAYGPVLAACLGRLGIAADLPQLATRSVDNSRGQQVGVVRIRP